MLVYTRISFSRSRHVYVRPPFLIKTFARLLIQAKFFVPDYNSLSNSNTLRGLRGPTLVGGMSGISLARYSLSMRKPCLESYWLEQLHRCKKQFLVTIA